MAILQQMTFFGLPFWVFHISNEKSARHSMGNNKFFVLLSTGGADRFPFYGFTDLIIIGKQRKKTYLQRRRGANGLIMDPVRSIRGNLTLSPFCHRRLRCQESSLPPLAQRNAGILTVSLLLIHYIGLLWTIFSEVTRGRFRILWSSPGDDRN